MDAYGLVDMDGWMYEVGYGWMDGWMDVWMDGWMDGRMVPAPPAYWETVLSFPLQNVLRGRSCRSRC